MAYDIIIRSGIIVDGTGGEPVVGDVAIEKDRIAAVGALDGVRAGMEILAAGKYVTPGFIDVTNHSDTHLTLFPYPGMESALMQGVTSVIGGNCGASLAPLASPDAIRGISKWADFSQVGIDWTGVGEFLGAIQRMRLGVNFGTCMGYGTLRRGIIGDEIRLLTLEEKEKIRFLIQRGMQEGALGVSFGLSYGHERESTTEEIIDIAGALRESHGVAKIHLRSEGSGVLAAVNEAIRIGREAGIGVLISHFKVIGKKSWPNAPKALELIANARSTGVDIHFDVSPYRTTGSPLYLLIPPWARRGGFAELFRRMDSQIERKRIIEALEQGTLHYDRIMISSAKHTSLVGKSMADIARSMGMSPEEALLETVRGNEGRVVIIGHTVSGKHTRAAIIDMNSFVASDGYAMSQDAAGSGNLPHPRSFGAFPHFWHRFVNDLKLLEPKEAITKITSGPARMFGIVGRGVIAKGNFADIAVFDPRMIRDRATYRNPYRYPAGMEWVMVNGKIAVSEGRRTAERAGSIVYK